MRRRPIASRLSLATASGHRPEEAPDPDHGIGLMQITHPSLKQGPDPEADLEADAAPPVMPGVRWEISALHVQTLRHIADGLVPDLDAVGELYRMGLLWDTPTGHSGVEIAVGDDLSAAVAESSGSTVLWLTDTAMALMAAAPPTPQAEDPAAGTDDGAFAPDGTGEQLLAAAEPSVADDGAEPPGEVEEAALDPWEAMVAELEDLRAQRRKLLDSKMALKTRLRMAQTEAAAERQRAEDALQAAPPPMQRRLTAEETVLLDMLDDNVPDLDRRAEYFKVLLAVMAVNRDTILAILASREARAMEPAAQELP